MNITPPVRDTDYKKFEQALFAVLAYAHGQDYAGYNKYDALDSPVLSLLSFGNKYLRLVYSQAIMRSPLNIRPLFLIPRTRNPKGTALFVMTYLNLFNAKHFPEYLDRAKQLLDWLRLNYSPGFSGMCWGYQYPWQDVGFYAPAHLPNRIVTYFVASAFLDAYDLCREKSYLDIARSSADFMLKDPKILYEDNNMKCLSYVPDKSINWVVMDVSALCAVLLSRLGSILNDSFLLQQAKKLIYYVVDKQTSYGAWFYTHPAGANRLKMHDNYHTGYILDAILDYSRYSGDNDFRPNYLHGLDYYYRQLFLPDGAPKWMNNKVYPLDVHGSAQGILTFLKAAQLDEKYLIFGRRIAGWAIDHMQNKRYGYFYYQQTRFYKKRFSIMHWSNAWMARALSAIIRRYDEDQR
jgi:hypothetical protein